MTTNLPSKKSTDELLVDCEIASAVLAECFAYFAKQLAEEKRTLNPNEDKVRTLEAKLIELKCDQLALNSENEDLINNALYILAPLLRNNVTELSKS